MNLKSTFFFIFLVLITLTVESQPTAFGNCPNANVAIVRSGSGGATTNPFSVYNINTATGAANLLSGPILDPADTSVNLQINGVGLNEIDGFMYGLFSDAPATLSLTPATPYYRLGSNSIAQQLGTLSGPTPTGSDNASFVFPNAGEFNQSGTYYFVATTGFVTINIFNLPASTFAPSTFYIGSLAGSNTLSGGTAALSPSFVAITNPSNDAAAYLSASSATITATSAQGLGLQDLVYNNADGNIYTYVSYADTATTGYFGQMLRINPTTGIMTAVAAPAIQPFLTSTVFPNGMLIDANGDFLIMLTNGDIYKANGASPTYTGTLSLLNTASGLPSTLTGDLAACGMVTIALPFDPFEFDVEKKNNNALVSWSNPLEDNVTRYVIQFSADGSDFVDVGSVAAMGYKNYSYEHPNNFTNAASYYRIKMLDDNNNATYSFIRALSSSVSEIRVFPNPVSNILTMNFSESWIGEEVKIDIINSVGQIVLQQEIDGTKYDEYLDLSSIKSGVYFLQLQFEEQKKTIRFVKE